MKIIQHNWNFLEIQYGTKSLPQREVLFGQWNLRRLKTSFGLDGVVCSWFRSYLTGRVQRVRRGSSVLASVVLQYGVPQRSVLGLGPLLFILYTADLIRLIESFGFRPHLYADDSQIQGSCRRFLSPALADPVDLSGCCM